MVRRLDDSEKVVRMPTRLQLARARIHEWFSTGQRRVFRQRDLERVLSDKREEWQLAQTTTVGDFVEYLIKGRKLRRLEFPFPHRREVRYTWGDVPLEVVLLTLKKGCHFSHYTAVQLHELTEQDPRTIYLNFEQTPKPSSEFTLAQEWIDLAFSRKPRMTRNIASIKGVKRAGVRICLINGKNTNYPGVEEREIHLGAAREPVSLRVTDIERTLIDVTVRPFYAGGVDEVRKAYVRAASRVSVNRLAATLRKLNYVYPYHQAVGFYLETTGVYDASSIDLFYGKFEYEFDFYLTYGMQETEYNERWRIHVPKGLIP